MYKLVATAILFSLLRKGYLGTIELMNNDYYIFSLISSDLKTLAITSVTSATDYILSKCEDNFTSI